MPHTQHTRDMYPLNAAPLSMYECPFHIGQEVWLVKKRLITPFRVVDFGWDQRRGCFIFELGMNGVLMGHTWWIPAYEIAPAVSGKPKLRIAADNTLQQQINAFVESD